MKHDAVHELLKVVGEVTQLAGADIARADEAIRREFGGRAMRIQPRAPLTIDHVDAELCRRKTVADIAGEVGISRSTIYRMLERNRVKNRKKIGNATPESAK